jgi:Na+/melibiose symporter-like transporter
VTGGVGEPPFPGPQPAVPSGPRVPAPGTPSDAGPPDAGPPASRTPAGPIDASRVRSFIGLSIGLVGPRANLAVSGVVITLFVQQRASGALAVTFALTANRLLSWLTYPVAGRLSDRTKSRVGRRTPYMAGSLIMMGAATWMFTVVKGYWLLVLFIVIARQAAAVFTLTNVAVVPEVFGRSRWIKALLLTTVLGTLASLTIKGTVIATWKQNDPATWNLPFQLAAVILVGVGIAILVLVREAPAATFGAEADRKQRARPARDELRDILSGPNAKVLVTGSLLFWAGVGSTAYVAILFFQRVLHAGASAQTIAGFVTGLPVFFIGIGLGVPLSRRLSPMQLAIGAPLIGAILAGVQYFDTHLWQAVLLSYIGAPFIGAYLIVLAPLLLQLLPRAGGLGERIGVLLAPFNLCSVILAYLAAVVIDATGNYRLIWVFPAATGLAHAAVNCWLKFPPKRASSPDMVARLWEWSVVQAESMAETGIVTGLLAAPLLGVVTEEDADSAVVIDMARNVLGNPYEDDPPDDASPTPALGTGADPEDQASSDDGGGGAGGVTGVRQVGGGPPVDRANGDQKSGWGESSRSGSADPSSTGGSMGVSEAGGVPVGGSSPRGPSEPSEGTLGTPADGVGSAGSSDPTGTGGGAEGGVDTSDAADGGGGTTVRGAAGGTGTDATGGGITANGAGVGTATGAGAGTDGGTGTDATGAGAGKTGPAWSTDDDRTAGDGSGGLDD